MLGTMPQVGAPFDARLITDLELVRLSIGTGVSTSTGSESDTGDLTSLADAATATTALVVKR